MQVFAQGGRAGTNARKTGREPGGTNLTSPWGVENTKYPFPWGKKKKTLHAEWGSGAKTTTRRAHQPGARRLTREKPPSIHVLWVCKAGREGHTETAASKGKRKEEGNQASRLQPRERRVKQTKGQNRSSLQVARRTREVTHKEVLDGHVEGL